jgi:hypothetical protein
MWIMSEETKHVVIKDGQGKCLHCGDCHPFVLPMLVSDWCAEAEAFVARHKACPKPPEKNLQDNS